MTLSISLCVFPVIFCPFIDYVFLNNFRITIRSLISGQVWFTQCNMKSLSVSLGNVTVHIIPFHGGFPPADMKSGLVELIHTGSVLTQANRQTNTAYILPSLAPLS